MTVIGTEQRVYGRVYGKLVNTCLIDLTRFAFIYGTRSETPPYTYGPATYPPPGQTFNKRFPNPGDSITFTSCIPGHVSLNPPIARLENVTNINGGISYIKTSFDILYASGGFISSNGNNEENQYYDDISICVVKFRIKGSKILLDVHGSVSTNISNISMWFNDAICDAENARWNRIGYADHDTIMPHNSFEFSLINYDKSLTDLTWCNGNIYIYIETRSSMISSINNVNTPQIMVTTKSKK